MAADAAPFELTASGGNALRGERAGEGSVVVQLHGLTATRRYVTHGSGHLTRSGFQTVLYDARGHGESDPAPTGEGYSYSELADDLGAVVDDVTSAKDSRVVLAGHSMGAHTATAYALRAPERVAALVVIGPVSLGEEPPPDTLAYWDRLADGLAEGGADGFMEVYDDGSHHPEWRETVLRLTRQRLELHSHPQALADALRGVPRSLPFEDADALAGLDVPTLIVASRDEADPAHPYETAVEWAERIPGAELTAEDDGDSPLAWQGGKLSRAIEEFCGRDEVRERLGE